jgi:ABC-2 type transport system ATP-binding protein
LPALPGELAPWASELSGDGLLLRYCFDSRRESGDIAAFLREVDRLGIAYRDLETKESSLEDIFVSLVGSKGQG